MRDERGNGLIRVDVREERRWRSSRATHSAAALSSTHVVSTQFAMKYRGDHRPCADDHNGLPAHLTGCRTQLPLSRSSTSILLSPPRAIPPLVRSPDLSSPPLRRPPLYPRHSYFLESRPVKRGKKSAVSNEEKFMRGASRNNSLNKA